MVPRKPPTQKSSKAAQSKALNPRKSTPSSKAPAQKQRGLLGPRRAPATPLTSPLGNPLAGPPSFTPPPRPLNLPNMGGGHMSNANNPLGQGGVGAGADNWIAGAIKKPGALHRDLGVPEGKKIPAKKLSAAASKGGKTGQRARLAQTLKGLGKG